MSLWERPCVAKGLRSSPRVSAVLHKPGLLRSPFATQGRTHIHTPVTHIASSRSKRLCHPIERFSTPRRRYFQVFRIWRQTP